MVVQKQDGETINQKSRKPNEILIFFTPQMYGMESWTENSVGIRIHIPQFSHLMHLSPQKSCLRLSSKVHFSWLFVQVVGQHRLDSPHHRKQGRGPWSAKFNKIMSFRSALRSLNKQFHCRGISQIWTRALQATRDNGTKNNTCTYPSNTYYKKHIWIVTFTSKQNGLNYTFIRKFLWQI